MVEGGGAFRAAPRGKKQGVLDLKDVGKSGTKNCIFLKRGSFGAAKVEKVESLGAPKAEKWGCGGCGGGGLSRGTYPHTRTVLIWEYPPPRVLISASTACVEKRNSLRRYPVALKET